MGVTESFFDLNSLKISEGRFISDLDANNHFCAVGADTAGLLRDAGMESLIGAHVTLGERIHTIIGVLEKVPMGGGMRPSGLNQ